MRTLLACLLMSAVFTVSCSGEKKPASTLSEAQRDSVLARSDVPGASAVGHAFDAAGKEASHAAQLDSLTH